VWVFPKSLMGDHKHVGRRLAQRTRANIVAESKTNGKERDRVDIRGHDLRRTAANLMASGGVPRFVISRILNRSAICNVTHPTAMRLRRHGSLVAAAVAASTCRSSSTDERSTPRS
jgi:hypothetical protein